MRLSFKLRAAINQYYAFKDKGRDGFFPSSEDKDRCCKDIVDAAKPSCIYVEIVPGTIFFKKGKQTLRVQGPVALYGRLDTSGPYLTS